MVRFGRGEGGRIGREHHHGVHLPVRQSARHNARLVAQLLDGLGDAFTLVFGDVDGAVEIPSLITGRVRPALLAILVSPVVVSCCYCVRQGEPASPWQSSSHTHIRSAALRLRFSVFRRDSL